MAATDDTGFVDFMATIDECPYCMYRWREVVRQTYEAAEDPAAINIAELRGEHENKCRKRRPIVSIFYKKVNVVQLK